MTGTPRHCSAVRALKSGLALAFPTGEVKRVGEPSLSVISVPRTPLAAAAFSGHEEPQQPILLCGAQGFV
jgi:hypothetical protein